MAYVEGPDLYHVLRDNPKLFFERALSFSRQLAEALAAAHGEGVIHRDLKPQNVPLSPPPFFFFFSVWRNLLRTTQ